MTCIANSIWTGQSGSVTYQHCPAGSSSVVTFGSYVMWQEWLRTTRPFSAPLINWTPPQDNGRWQTTWNPHGPLPQDLAPVGWHLCTIDIRMQRTPPDCLTWPPAPQFPALYGSAMHIIVKQKVVPLVLNREGRKISCNHNTVTHEGTYTAKLLHDM